MDEFGDLRREAQRLRAENARLSRLLELRGQDTAPAPEQMSAPVAAPGLVTMASPVADKLALFADRFRARADVYAVRWENTRTGAAGWMPAVAGGWRKGMDRRGAVHLPRTPEELVAVLPRRLPALSSLEPHEWLYQVGRLNTAIIEGAEQFGPADWAAAKRAQMHALAMAEAAGGIDHRDYVIRLLYLAAILLDYAPHDVEPAIRDPREALELLFDALPGSLEDARRLTLQGHEPNISDMRRLRAAKNLLTPALMINKHLHDPQLNAWAEVYPQLP